MKARLSILLLLFCAVSNAQKINSIAFHLYTDSLKKGFYNYINVDGKTSSGWLPLTANEVTFTANTGFFHGNDLFIDSSYKADSVVVKAILKSEPTVWQEITIYIRKRGFPPLKATDEVLHEGRRRN